MTERLWCKACGTVTRDQTCDCNRWHNEMSREPNFVNYADAMQETAHEQAQRIEALEAALQQSVDDWRGRGRRIEALEFEVEHERYNVEKTAQEAAKRIKVLEAALKEAGEMWVRKDNRIEQLETALLEIDRALIAASTWIAVDEIGNDNFATSIYEAGYEGLLVARCNQNGQYPWQGPAIIRGLEQNKSIASSSSPKAST